MMTQDSEALGHQIQLYKKVVDQIFDQMSQMIVGQKTLIERLIIGLLMEGHVLVEGAPGLAKTTAIKALSQILNLDFKRIQFTPDLLPADVVGTQIYNPKTQDFSVKKGPVFTNLLLADEINRAPAKVQSALLEAMQERQVTLGEQSFTLSRPFMVMATQNPLEQEGTYPLPEAQIDRFMLKLKVGYPSPAEEAAIIDQVSLNQKVTIDSQIGAEHLNALKELIAKVYLDPKVKEYIVRIVFATRQSAQLKLGLEKYIQYGASPRASIFLYQVAKAYAFLQGRAYVTPQDVKVIGPDVLRHRLILSYEAEAEGLNSDDILKTIFDHVEVP